MIPKVIHYCWFGYGEKSPLVKKCIDSWKKLLPEYEIIEWNESNFDIHMNKYVEEAYEKKKWAFVSDYVRLYVLYQYGGVYFDTDVEIFKNIDEFLNDNAFACFESNDSVSAAVLAAVKNHEVIGNLLDSYKNRRFINENGECDLTTNVRAITKYFKSQGLKMNGRKQEINDFKMYPAVIFSPNTFGMIFGKISSKTVTIHHYEGSWTGRAHNKNFKYRILHWLSLCVRNLIGTENYSKIRKNE